MIHASSRVRDAHDYSVPLAFHGRYCSQYQLKSDSLLARAYLQHGYTLVEIGRAAGLHYARASRIIKAMEETS